MMVCAGMVKSEAGKDSKYEKHNRYKDIIPCNSILMMIGKISHYLSIIFTSQS